MKVENCIEGTSPVMQLTLFKYALNFIRLIRPRDWIKNGFVFVGLLFSHAWQDLNIVQGVVIAACAFCMCASSIYIFNDIFDRENDRRHPKKKFRPIAAKEVSVFAASLLAALLCIFGLGVGYLVSDNVCYILIVYLLINVLYSIKLKHIVIIDVFCIASGFMLRILSGTLGIEVPPSKWLLLCGLMITLFLGFAKRRAEIMTLCEEKAKHRRVLKNYGADFLDNLLSICATGVIITYSLYTMSDETYEIHKTDQLIYTVPFVIYGLFRYLFLLHHRNMGGDPSKELVRDKHTLFALIGWLSMVLYLIY